MTDRPERGGPRRPLISPQTLAIVLILASLIVIAVWLATRHRAPSLPTPVPTPPAVQTGPLAPGTLPDRTDTPGAIDPAVTGADICAHDWAPGDPPTHGGDLTYSQAARHTSTRLKNDVFEEYGIPRPHDGGRSYEVDHLVPLALGGRDVKENLWPESRTAPDLNAWAKDRLEYRLYRMVCHPDAGASPLPLGEAQAALRDNWVAAYRRYCSNPADCPAHAE
ncbi:hypothetical protein Y88_3091 [Novosphingobium nitrogenifigens DSM 19370]|uniref:HNH endonuclease n=1 Tax=Novosphingobium nitrogenifigens DSM 19370 TaxID=983920 RepID=F1ZCF3_9SPHN|nr:HNH endonuclease signature motif containing protein [Novosphingobium nitrogenifigens]EGD57765.1 hypothetical protein Y88_3091 [Novosphingobium nitrogenifigens DSM 19370]